MCIVAYSARRAEGDRVTGLHVSEIRRVDEQRDSAAFERADSATPDVWITKQSFFRQMK